ncbi:MAG TPA: NUDIX hydrolase [bacterium]|nr:NUDIX hydrolase [bacterium]
MYVGPELIAEAEERFGRPPEEDFRVDTTPAEIAFIRGTQKNGRAHDVTVVIRNGDVFATIAKHSYPPGLFRFPSGGADPGESLEDASLREGREETGLELALTRYLLRARVRFDCRPEDDAIDWTTHVFCAEVRGGRLEPIDEGEIREAAWLSRRELLGPIREVLFARPEAGLRYRGRLQDAIFARLDGLPGGGEPSDGGGR